MWDKDSTIDPTEPGNTIIKVPNLHAKYAKQLVAHSLSSKAKQGAYNALRKVKYDYFSGKMDQAELTKRGLEPFRFVLKGDINTYIDADEEILALRARIAIHDEAAEMCRMILKELNNRVWEIKAFIEWEKFIGGSG
jgi:hypothetical protein